MITALFVLSIVFLSLLVLGALLAIREDDEEVLLFFALLSSPVALALAICSVVNYFL